MSPPQNKIKNKTHLRLELFNLSIKQVALGLILFFLIQSIFLFYIKTTYDEKAHQDKVNNTILSLLRLSVGYINYGPYQPILHKQTEVDSKTQRNQYNYIIGTLPNSINIDPYYIDVTKFEAIKEKLYTNKSIFLTFYSGRDAKWVTFYAFIDASSVFWPLLLMSIIMQLIVIGFLLFLIYIYRYVFPKRMLKAASKTIQSHLDVGDDTLPSHLQAHMVELNKRIRQLIYQKIIMLSSMTHDMKNSITKIRLLAYFSNNKETTLGIEKELDEIQTIIESSLAFSEGRLTKNKKHFDIKLFVDTFVRHFHAKGFDFEYQCLLETTFIDGYPGLLKRALSNILINAKKYSTEYNLSLSKEKQGHDKSVIVIKVTDNGPGVSKESLAKITEPFYRGMDENIETVEGHGLGLAITKTAVDFNQGALHIRNKPEGGLEIKVILPIPK